MSALTTVLPNLFIIYAAAKLVGAVFARFGQPSVIGELLAGIVIGPHALGLIVASLGFSLGIIPAGVFSMLVVMSIATTLLVPPLLTAIYRRSPEPGASTVITRDVTDEFALDVEAPVASTDVYG